MPRPSFFGKKKPEVLRFVRVLSEDYRVNRGDSLSLQKIATKLRTGLKFVKRFEAAAIAAKKEKARLAGEKYVEPQNPDDALKLVVYRLCNSNGIWFGDPRKMPSRMKTPKSKEKKASK